MSQFTVPTKKQAPTQNSVPVVSQTQPTNKVADNSINNSQQKPTKQSQQDDLINLATQDFVLFHSPEGEPYAKVIVNGSRRVMHLRSEEFKKLLGVTYHQTRSKVASRQALDDTIQLLTGMAIYTSPEEEVFIRTAPYNGNIIVDLSNDQGQSVQISQSGWQLLANSPVNFLRLKSQRQMPLPLKGGKLTDFAPFINTETKEDFIMVMAFTIFSLHPKGPFPVLVLNGGGGSCKSTGAHMIKCIVDPSSAVNFAQPKNLQNVFVNAANAWLVTYDNISEIKTWFSDALCQIATGASHGAKKLYTDGDEFQIIVKRPIIVAGIGDLITRGDLARRSITARLKDIVDTPEIKTEDQIWEQFYLKLPYLLGWICNALSAGLRNLHSINENYSTMADFSRFLAAADREIWTPGTFNKAYRSNMSKVVKQVIQADPVALCVIALMQNNIDCKGTASDALQALSYYLNDVRTLHSKEWPQGPNKLRGFLEESQNLLKKEGIEIQFDIFENGKRLMRIYKPNEPVPEITNVPVIDHIGAMIDIADNPQSEDQCASPDRQHQLTKPNSDLIKIRIQKDKELADLEAKLTPEERASIYQSVFD